MLFTRLKKYGKILIIPSFNLQMESAHFNQLNEIEVEGIEQVKGDVIALVGDFDSFNCYSFTFT